MSLSAREYLQHILDETTYITTNSVNLDKTEFLHNETLKRAYVRSLEVIGEAVKQLLDALRQKYDAIEWRAMAGMRDRLQPVQKSSDWLSKSLSRSGRGI